MFRGDYMDIIILILIIVLIVGVFLIFKLIKKIIAAVFAAFVLLFVIMAALGLFAYLDFKDFQENMTENNLMVLQEDDVVLSAVSFKFKSEDKDDRFNFVDSKTLGSPFNHKDHEKTYYKIVEFDLDVTEKMFSNNVEFEFNNESINISKENAIEILKSKTPANDVVTLLVDSIEIDENLESVDEIKEDISANIAEEIGGDEEVKGAMFGMFLTTKLKEEPTSTLKSFVSYYKSKDIRVYEKTMILRIFDSTPKSIIVGVLNKANIKIDSEEE